MRPSKGKDALNSAEHLSEQNSNENNFEAVQTDTGLLSPLPRGSSRQLLAD